MPSDLIIAPSYAPSSHHGRPEALFSNLHLTNVGQPGRLHWGGTYSEVG